MPGQYLPAWKTTLELLRLLAWVWISMPEHGIPTRGINVVLVFISQVEFLQEIRLLFLAQAFNDIVLVLSEKPSNLASFSSYRNL